jgi:hypothetical protein
VSVVDMSVGIGSQAIGSTILERESREPKSRFLPAGVGAQEFRRQLNAASQ